MYAPIPPPNQTFTGLWAFFAGCFQVLVRYFPILAGVSLGMLVPFVLLQDWLAKVLLYSSQSSALSLESLLGFVLVYLSSLAIYLIQSLVLACILASKLAERGPTLSEALRWGVTRAPLVFGYSLVAMLLVAAGSLCLILPGVYLALRLFPVSYVALFEPGQQPLTRSWELTRDRALEAFLAHVGLGCVLLPIGVATVAVLNFNLDIPGVLWGLHVVGLLVQWIVSTVFWLLLYGWFREEMNPSGLGLSEVQIP